MPGHAGDAMRVIYARQPLPEDVVSSIFLAGPSPRPGVPTPSWRPEALELLRAASYRGTVLVPEDEGGGFAAEADCDAHEEAARERWAAQCAWEDEAIARADCILFWIPRRMRTMPGLTTNDEWGAWKDSGKAVLGTPDGAEHVGYQRRHAGMFRVPICRTLAETVGAALLAVGEGELRRGGEARVPLCVWRHPTFRAWLSEMREAGNRLDGARVLWTFRVGKDRSRVFCWAVHVDVHVAVEGRNKTNEFVLGRTDVCGVVMYRRPADPALDPVLDAEVVLVKEFRSPVRNSIGYVYEVPGGSAADIDDTDDHDLATAAKEVFEETGLRLDPPRLRRQGRRQPAATLSAHAATVFSVELTEVEMERMRGEAADGTPHGVAADTEITYVDVTRARDVIDSGLADWTTIGMVMTALNRRGGGQ